MDCIVLDGSRGEGGGQTVRTALALSCITGRPVEVERIRHNRKTPGLRPQHLAACRILQKMCGGRLEGGGVGSTRIRFLPGPVRDAAISESVGTAGSIPLVLQAAIPACWAAGRRLELTVVGGTDVRWAPTADYTRHVLGAAYSTMGIRMSMDVARRGYYPSGGGRVRVVVEPSGLKPAHLTCGYGGEMEVLCTFSGIDEDRISGALEPVVGRLTDRGRRCRVNVRGEESQDPGAAVLVWGSGPGFVAGADSLYDNGFNFRVADSAVCAIGADANLADMLVVPASVAKGTSVFRVNRITKHLETGLYTASKITGCRYGASEVEGGFEIRVEGTG